jgi:hypothetical protein
MSNSDSWVRFTLIAGHFFGPQNIPMPCKLAQNFAKASSKQIKTLPGRFFCNFDPKLKIRICQGHVKTFPKKNMFRLTLFFHLILKNTKKKSEKFKIFDFFLFLFWLFCAFETLTIDLVHFYDIITAENVGTGIPLKALFTCHFAIVK